MVKVGIIIKRAPTRQEKGSDYENQCRDLIHKIKNRTALHNYVVGSGAKNKIAGSSGYRHQIDVSLSGENQLFIIELKNLSKSIGVAEILVLAARFIDITAAQPSTKVRASIISTKKPSRNVLPLAKQFGLIVDIVEDLNSYALSFSNQHFIGQLEKIDASDQSDATVIRGNL